MLSKKNLKYTRKESIKFLKTLQNINENEKITLSKELNNLFEKEVKKIKLASFKNKKDLYAVQFGFYRGKLKGGHHHRKNYAVCECGKIYRVKHKRRVMSYGNDSFKFRAEVSYWCKESKRHPDGIPMPF